MGNLLIIDADTAGRGIVRSRLGDAGHRVKVSETCALGIEAALGHGFDGILVAADLDEGSSGLDVCHNLRGHRELQDTPLIVYSLLREDEALVSRALEAGAYAAITPGQAPQFERLVEASLVSSSRVGSLRERQDVLRQEQRRLTESLGAQTTDSSTLAPGSHGPGHPDALLLVGRSGVIHWCDRDSWTLLGRNCVGANLRDIARSSGLFHFVRSARTTSQHGFRFDLPGQGGIPGRPLVASAHPVGDSLHCVLLNDRSRREVAIDEQARRIEPRQVSALMDGAERAYGLDRIPGDGPIASYLRNRIAARASDREPLLLAGETGSGRAFLARVLHFQNKYGGAFLRVRCNSFARESLERELFGTSADGADGISRAGALLLAGNGTLLLEHIETMPLELQGRLLEFLVSRGVRQGKNGEFTEARLVATSSYDLRALAAQGRFLPDLAELLEAWRLEVPALRNRGEELAGIIEVALERSGAVGVDEAALRLLHQHSWPRNFEELDDVIEGAVSRADGEPIGVGHLSRALTELGEELSGVDGLPEHRPSGAESVRQTPASPWSIGTEDPISFEFYEKQAIVRALHACRGDRLAAARLLELGKSTLYRKIRRFGIA